MTPSIPWLFSVSALLAACGGSGSTGDAAHPGDSSNPTDAQDIVQGPDAACGHLSTPCCTAGICRVTGLTCGTDGLCHDAVALYSVCGPGDSCQMGSCIAASLAASTSDGDAGTYCSTSCTSVASCAPDPDGTTVVCIGPADAGLTCYRSCGAGMTCPVSFECAVYTDAMGVMTSFCVPQ